MIDVAETVKNGDERDSLKREIIFNALGIGTSPPNKGMEPAR